MMRKIPMKILPRVGLMILVLSILSSCAGQVETATPSQNSEPASYSSQEWPTSTPEEQGMDSQVLNRMFHQIEEKQLKLHSLLVIRNGFLVSEAYFHPYTVDRYHNTASVTKSVIGALVGIAIDRGYIKDVHQTLVSLLPVQNIKNLDARKKAITLEHLLTLTTGFECNDFPGSGQPGIEQSKNWVEYMLDRPMAADPGTQFNYCTGAVHLLSAILEETTGMRTREFANQYLFEPVGISSVPVTRWSSDPQGVNTGGYGLYLTPREMAKIGYLYLRQGQWEGKQVVPSSWVAVSTTVHTLKDDGYGYGDLWTVDPKGKFFAALGLGGQHIFVMPELEMVVVFTGGFPGGNNRDFIPLVELLEADIIQAVKSDRPLPENPESVADLNASIQNVLRPRRAVQPLPAIAQAISGKTYTLDENPLGWYTMTLFFEDGKDIADVSVNNTHLEPSIGLDNLFRILEREDGLPPGALRGSWTNETTFIVQEIQVGEFGETQYEIQLSGDEIQIIRKDLLFGNEIKLHGRIK